MNRTKSPATVQESHAIDYIGLRGLFLKLFLGFLGLTAVVAIVSVLSGDFGKVQAKVLATCFTVSAASICSMSCAAFMEKRKHVRLGMTGIALSIGSGLLVIVGLWPEIDAEEYLKTTATVGVAGIAFAYIFLLLIPELDVRHRWLQRVFAGSVGILAVLIVVAMWGEINEEGYYRALAVVAILVGLQTLAIPIMTRFRAGSESAKATLVLQRSSDGIYRDAKGRMYRLTEVSSAQEDA